MHYKRTATVDRLTWKTEEVSIRCCCRGCNSLDVSPFNTDSDVGEGFNQKPVIFLCDDHAREGYFSFYVTGPATLDQAKFDYPTLA
jgi:hypothetical protein